MSLWKSISVKDSDGNLINPAISDKYITNIQVDSGDSNIKYFGFATAGTATSSALWRILRKDGTAGTVFLYADGDTDFDNIWDNREALSYS